MSGGKGVMELPKKCEISVNNLNVLGCCYQIENENLVILFNRNPEIPINENISFSLNNFERKINLYAIGWSQRVKFNMSFIRDINMLSIKPGAGVSANAGLVFTSVH